MAQLYAKASEFYVRSGSGITNKMTGPLAVTPISWVDGYLVTWSTAARVQIEPGICRDSTDIFDIVLAANQIVDITVAGLNGLDAGGEAANTWYAIYIVGDSTRVNPTGGLLSTNFTTPTLPAGYDVFRRVGCVRNGAADFLRFFQYGNGMVRRYYYDEAQATLQVLTNGAAIVFTTVSLGALVPSPSREVLFGVSFLAPTVGGATTDVLTIHPTGANEATGPTQFRSGAVSAAGGGLRVDAELLVSAGQQIDYMVTDADDLANLWVLGFDDEL